MNTTTEQMAEDLQMHKEAYQELSETLSNLRHRLTESDVKLYQSSSQLRVAKQELLELKAHLYDETKDRLGKLGEEQQ